MTSPSDFDPLRLYRNGEQGLILGVLAGIATHVGTAPGLARLIALVFLIALPLPTALAYLVAGLLLPNKPAQLGLDATARAFRAALQESPEQAMQLMEAMLARSRRRLERIEAYVTSDAFDLYGTVARQVYGQNPRDSEREAQVATTIPAPPVKD